MVGIVRNAQIKFVNEKAFKNFERKMNKQSPRISIKKLQEEVNADGIKIIRGGDQHVKK